MIKEYNIVKDREGNKKVYFVVLNKAGTGYNDCCFKYVGNTEQVEMITCTCRHGTIQASIGELIVNCRHVKECKEYLDERKRQDDNDQKVD